MGLANEIISNRISWDTSAVFRDYKYLAFQRRERTILTMRTEICK